jgi:pyruvate/2-oxoglutarate dehydrogenase complex dihydrolipoamide dehydrogenase (E3) component
MSKNIPNEQDVVVVGGGTSGVMCALGAIRYGLKVTLICNKSDFSQSSLLAEFIPSKAFAYSAALANKIKQAKHFGLDSSLAPVNLSRVNGYVQRIVQELQQENDLETFEKLGGSLLIGTARFVNNHTILVGNIQVFSKYFVIATGTREAASNIIDFEQAEPIKYRQIFYKSNLAKKTIIIGGRAESLEMAQALARFGSKVTLISSKSKILPLEDQELVKKLQNTLEQEGVTFYLTTNVLQFYLQNQRKLLVCQDSCGDKFAVDAEEIIDMRDPQPNVEDLTLQNTSIQYCSEGILVNSRLQTSEKNIFAIGSVAKSSFKSVHLTEHQINVILSNIVFKVPRKINYKLIPRVLFTCPQLATIGITQIQQSDQKQIKVLQFDFNKVDAAILQRHSSGEVKLICQRDKLLGASVLGPIATELIAEYSFAMQVGAGVSDIANSIHAYPTLSQINKRVAHKIFNKNNLLISTTTVAIEKAMHKMHQMVSMLSFAT